MFRFPLQLDGGRRSGGPQHLSQLDGISQNSGEITNLWSVPSLDPFFSRFGGFRHHVFQWLLSVWDF